MASGPPPGPGTPSLEDHVAISDITLDFKNGLKTSKKLKILIDSDSVDAIWDPLGNQTVGRWTFKPITEIWPKSILTVQAYEHRTLTTLVKPRKCELMKIKAEKLLEDCSGSTEEKEYVETCRDFTMTLKISLLAFSTRKELGNATSRQEALANSDIVAVFGQSLSSLGVVIEIAKGVAAIHPVAQAAVNALSSVLERVKQVGEFHSGLLDLGSRMKRLLSLLSEIKDHATIEYMKDTIVDIMKTVSDAARYTQAYLAKTSSGRLLKTQFPDELNALKERFTSLDGEVKNAMSAQMLISHEEEKHLKRIEPSQQPRIILKCLEGTRKGPLKAISSWMDDPTAPNILWLSGSPGAGKSAIAAAVASDLRERGMWGTSFFFKSGDAYWGNPLSFWRSVAYHLAAHDSHGRFRHSIVPVLRDSKAAAHTADVDLDFRCLIEAPLQQEALSLRAVVVILDALDEAGTVAERKILLNTLSKWSRLSPAFKLIVTSRYEHDIVGSLGTISLHIDLPSGDQVDGGSEASADIRLFLRDRFSNVTRENTAWPNEEAIDQITSRAAGLFIFAETMTNLLLRDLDPEELLTSILTGRGEFGLDDLYQAVLRRSLGDNPSPRTLHIFRRIVGTIILAKTPLSRMLLEGLLQSTESNISVGRTLSVLSSVISTEEKDELIRTRHQSFADFLTDPQKKSNEFFIDRNKQSLDLLECCLRVMNKELKFNICDLESSHCFNSDVPNLTERIASKISGPLAYSCRFWGQHFWEVADTDSDPSLLKQMQKFLHRNLLSWLEVASLMGEVPNASWFLACASRRISQHDERLSAFAADASRFVVNFRPAISSSAPHIYLSALPFCPEESEVKKHYSAIYPHTLDIEVGQDKHWPALVAVCEGHTAHVRSVAFSPDGKYIASGSEDNTVRIWDVEKGTTAFGPFEGHSDGVSSTSFSPDGKYVVSGSKDKTLRLWDVEKGTTAFGPFAGHTDVVRSAAFSPDGKYVVSGSKDKTVRVWDVEKGTTVFGPFKGHTGYVMSVAFSPDGKYVVSGSGDQTVRVWDVEKGTTAFGPFAGHTDVVTSVAFSPDGRLAVSGSDDKTVRVWDVEKGATAFGPFEGHTDRVWSAAISPNGRYVVSGSFDKKVRVWDVETGITAFGPFEGHTGHVMSVAFSPDGKSVVSASRDKTVRVWEVEKGTTALDQFEGHTRYVMSVAFSPDGQYVVSGSWDKTVRVWDIKKGTTVFGPFRGHTHSIVSVAFSPDGRYVVSGSKDKTLRVWDVEKGTTAFGPFEEHIGYVMSVAFSPDGKYVVSGSRDEAMRVWDVKKGTTTFGPFEGHTGAVTSAAFSPDGIYIVSGSWDETVRVWDVEKGTTVFGPFEGHTGVVTSVAFSPDGKYVVSGSCDKTVRVWDFKKGATAFGPFEGHTDSVWSVAISPDGRYVVSGSFDKTVRVWDVEKEATAFGPFEGHTDKISSVGFSLDGNYVVSGSDDKTVRVWDVEKGRTAFGLFEGHTNSFMPVSDSKSVVSVAWGKERRFSDTEQETLPHFIQESSRESGIPDPLSSHRGGFTYRSQLASTGWMCTPSGDLLFWVPLQARHRLWRPSNNIVLGVPVIKLDFNKFKPWSSWRATA